MSYDHRDRVGNEGDLVKHAVLARFVQEIVGTIAEDTFVYAESHTGRALYRDLPKSGRWRFGIGPFSRSLLQRENTTGLVPLQQEYPNLMAYKSACFHKEIVSGCEYPGSSGIVSNILKSAGKCYRFQLWDWCASVCKDLRRHYEDAPGVTVNEGSGYEGVAGISEASLVLVDPVDVEKEKEKILCTLRVMRDKAIPFLCWTALVKGQEAAFQDFKASTDKDYSAQWVTWRPKEGTTIGCQITVPKGTWESLAVDTIGEVSKLMKKDWEG